MKRLSSEARAIVMDELAGVIDKLNVRAATIPMTANWHAQRERLVQREAAKWLSDVKERIEGRGELTVGRNT